MPTVLLLAALVAPAQPPNPAVRLPAEVAAVPGRIVQLKADTAGKVVRWAVASDAADLIPFPGTPTALFSSPTPGRYLVLAWSAVNGEPTEAARCWVVVGNPAPPAPADPFAADLRAAFAADAGADKAAHLAQLAALYREAVAFAGTADVKTAGELAGRIRAAAAALVPADALLGVRKRVAAEVAAALPADGEKPLDAATRKTAADLFARVAAALEGVK